MAVYWLQNSAEVMPFHLSSVGVRSLWRGVTGQLTALEIRLRARLGAMAWPRPTARRSLFLLLLVWTAVCWLSFRPGPSPALQPCGNPAVGPDPASAGEAPLLQSLARQLPNLPGRYWEEESESGRKKAGSGKKEQCGLYPELWDLQFNNRYWQQVDTAAGRLYLWGAYWDSRAVQGGAVVRLLVMADSVTPQAELHCQFWREGEAARPATAPVTSFTHIWAAGWKVYGRLQVRITSSRNLLTVFHCSRSC